MPQFMDVHETDGGVTMDDVAKDIWPTGKRRAHDVRYLRFWVDEDHGRVFCLVEAPSSEAANAVHAKAYGQVADRVYQIQERS
jgi:hypothetical protein